MITRLFRETCIVWISVKQVPSAEQEASSLAESSTSIRLEEYLSKINFIKCQVKNMSNTSQSYRQKVEFCTGPKRLISFQLFGTQLFLLVVNLGRSVAS
jgi:hypothetical protein